MAAVEPVEEVIIGDDHELELVAVDRAGDRVDLTGNVVSFRLVRFPNQTPLLLKATDTDPAYIAITNAKLGEFKITLPASVSTLMTKGRWLYVMKRTIGGNTYTIGQNEVWVHSDSDNWSWKDVQEHMLDHLGAGVLDVELTSSQIFSCIRTAVNEYSRLLPLRLYNVISVPKRGRVDLTAAGFGRGLLDVRPDRQSGFDTGFGFSFPVSALIAGYGGGASVVGSIGAFEETLGYIEQVSRVTSSEFEWEWDPPYLYVANMPQGQTKLFYAVADDHIVQTVPSPDREWVNKFSLAKAKGILGGIRGKYGQVNTPGGGTSLDGDTLRQESSQEIQTLMEELRKKVVDDSFIWG